MPGIKNSNKPNKKNSKIRFGKFHLENDIIRDAHKVICNKNLEKFRRYWHWKNKR